MKCVEKNMHVLIVTQRDLTLAHTRSLKGRSAESQAERGQACSSMVGIRGECHLLAGVCICVCTYRTCVCQGVCTVHACWPMCLSGDMSLGMCQAMCVLMVWVSSVSLVVVSLHG